jgi:hypothetical protein
LISPCNREWDSPATTIDLVICLTVMTIGSLVTYFDCYKNGSVGIDCTVTKIGFLHAIRTPDRFAGYRPFARAFDFTSTKESSMSHCFSARFGTAPVALVVSASDLTPY